MDAEATTDEAGPTRTAKSCGPDAAVLVSSSREARLSRATVAKEPFTGIPESRHGLLRCARNDGSPRRMGGAQHPSPWVPALMGIASLHPSYETVRPHH